MNICSYFKRLLQDELHFLHLLYMFVQDLMFYLRKYYEKCGVFYTIALLTLFSLWIEWAHSTTCLVSSNSQINET